MEVNKKSLNKSDKKDVEDTFRYDPNSLQNSQLSVSMKRTLSNALVILDSIASKLDLPKNVREKGAVLYREALEKGLIKGRSSELIVAATIYAAARMCNVPRTLYEVSEVARFNYKDIGRTYTFLKWELDLKIDPIRPADLVDRFCLQLQLSKKVQERAKKILNDPNTEEKLTGRSPPGTACAAIYLATIMEGDAKSQREISDIGGVIVATLRKNLKQLDSSMKIEWLVS